MKKTFSVLIWVVLAILIFVGFVYSIWSIQRTHFNEFENEIEHLIETNDLTEYQEEKILYKINEYAISDFSTVEGFKAYTTTGFERYLKQYDYDFWYKIKIIFEE